jgi:hypothetical protein
VEGVPLALPNSIRQNICSRVARPFVVCGTGFASVVVRGKDPDHWQSQCHTWLIAELRLSCRTIMGMASDPCEVKMPVTELPLRTDRTRLQSCLESNNH